jgi:tetratricopeptide (TPR) repeat protein
MIVLVAGVSMLLGSCSGCSPAAVSRDPEADALQARGKVLLAKRQLSQARSVLVEALERHRAAGDRASASRDASLLSEVYQKTNEYRDALVLAEEARLEAVESGDRAALGTALIAVGTTLQRVGDSPRALATYEEAAPLLPESDRSGRSRLAIYRALAHKSEGRLAAAEDHLEQGFELAREAGDHGHLVGSSVNLADLALTEGRLDDAERHLRDARAASHARGDPKPTAMILVNEALLAQLRGNLPAALRILDEVSDGASPDTELVIAKHRGAMAEHAQQLDKAEEQYRKAVEIVERLRLKFAPEDARAQFLEQRWEPYEKLFALQLRRGNARDAFATLAQAQGRMFFDALAASLADGEKLTASAVGAAIARIDALGRVRPALARSHLGSSSSSSDEILAALRGRHVLTYFAAAGRMRMMAVVNGEPRITGVAIDLGELDKLIDDFRSRPDDPARAEALGRALVSADALPESPARLHIIPTGPLLRVPFAALKVGGQRLLDGYEVVYSPGVTGLAAMSGNRADGAGPGIVLADTRSGLAHAESEMKYVVEQTGAVPQIGDTATKAALRAAAGQWLLHVISHSGLGLDGGYLVLADGEVTAADIVDWRIGPRLAVLPTCASAATVRKEMWGSLTAAFLAAGSQHVVGTVASVEDHIGAEFTRLFYRAGGLADPVGAVTRAQREMARRHRVGTWSSFVVAGL